RLDVPAHQTAEQELHRARLADQRTLGRDGPEALGLVAHREPHLGGRDAVTAGPGGANLLLQAREQGGHVRLVSHGRSLGGARYGAVRGRSDVQEEPVETEKVARGLTWSPATHHARTARLDGASSAIRTPTCPRVTML